MNRLFLSDLLISHKFTLQDALRVLEENAQGIGFVVDDNKKMIGTLTDGDVRRSFIAGRTILDSVTTCMNKNFKSLLFDARSEEIVVLLKNGVTHIPLLDQTGAVVDFASESRRHQISVMEPFLGGNELAYVTECIQTKWISSQGKFVIKFEEQFADLHQGHAVAVSNGTVALHLALLSLNIGPGDEVIVPDLTFAATINAVIHAGATPVIVDIEQKTWGMDPKALEAAISNKTKAIIVVHLYGQPANMNAIMTIAKTKKLKVIEDVAEALGAKTSGSLMGTFGDAACYSFFGNKLVTTGEGGMVVYRNSENAARAKTLRDHGMAKDRRYWHNEVGYNYRMTNLQAAVGVAQMERFDEIISRKINLAERYFELFSEFDWVEMPPRLESDESVYWLFTILISKNAPISRDELIRCLALNGIESRPVFFPMHHMPLYREYARGKQMKVSEDVSERGISLPSSVLVSNAELARIKSVFSSVQSLKALKHRPLTLEQQI